MWTCPRCGKSVNASLDLCRNCGASRRSAQPTRRPSEPEPPEVPDWQETTDSQPGQAPEEGSAWSPGPFTEEEAVREAPALRRTFDWLGQYDRGEPDVGPPSWVCQACGQTVGGEFEFCPNCQTARQGQKPPAGEHGPEDAEDLQAPQVPLVRAPGEPRVAFRHFCERWSSWDELFQRAADFATAIGPERLISISHSADHSDGVVTVWYWRK
ncbi:MAG: hypothetical protein JXB62_13215 [Pirellulales bacterium]|nr:hypothetical protein [Pirellulales bacterium]